MRFLLGMIGLLIAFTLGVVVAWQPLTLERIYEEYNWFEMYEDGTYQGELTDGYWVQGCIKGAICED